MLSIVLRESTVDHGRFGASTKGSAADRGGVNCTGSLHIGSPDATGFDGDITAGSDVFQRDGPGLDTSFSPKGQNSCAQETTRNLSTQIARWTIPVL